MISGNKFTVTMVLLAGLSMCYAYPIREKQSEQVWPEACKGKSYCHIQPDYYPKETFAKLLDGVKFNFEQGGGLGNRSSDLDVANCPTIKIFEKFYLILDEENKIRFVAQNDNVFTFKMEIEECSTPGRTYDSSALDEDQLQEQRVDCYETRQSFKFPVLSLDGTKLEAVAPKDGVPLSCSAKVIAS